ncbi:hypothetical protein B0H11DRAFT_2419303 [Mycena galericulata]|nr:hypothetical protein B0H11DRAFT_2419303 [Mycena galericulata]
MEFLWVRWLGIEPGHHAGFRRARLPKFGYVPESDPYAFGFLDPALVIRGAHLIPHFAGGRTNELLGTMDPTAARAAGDTEDWANYYVNIFADRDMLMRFVGGGVGHLDVDSLSGTDIEEQDDQDDEGNVAAAQVVDWEADDDKSDSDSDSDSEDEGEEGNGKPTQGGEGDEEEEEETPEEDMDMDAAVLDDRKPDSRTAGYIPTWADNTISDLGQPHRLQAICYHPGQRWLQQSVSAHQGFLEFPHFKTRQYSTRAFRLPEGPFESFCMPATHSLAAHLIPIHVISRFTRRPLLPTRACTFSPTIYPSTAAYTPSLASSSTLTKPLPNPVSFPGQEFGNDVRTTPYTRMSLPAQPPSTPINSQRLVPFCLTNLALPSIFLGSPLYLRTCILILNPGLKAVVSKWQAPRVLFSKDIKAYGSYGGPISPDGTAWRYHADALSLVRRTYLPLNSHLSLSPSRTNHERRLLTLPRRSRHRPVAGHLEELHRY